MIFMAQRKQKEFLAAKLPWVYDKLHRFKNFIFSWP